MPLRNRLVLVVAVPLFVLLGFAGAGILTRLDDLSAQREYGRLRPANAALTALSTSLEQEGVLSAWTVSSPADATARSELRAARDATDRAVVSVRFVGRSLGDDVAGSTTRAWDGLATRLSGLETLRTQVDERAGLPAVFGDRFAALDAEVLDVAQLVATDVEDRSLSTSMQAALDLTGERAASAREAMVLVPYLATGSSTQLSQWVSAIHAQDRAVAEFLAVAQPAERVAFDAARAERGPTDPVRSSSSEVIDEFPATSTTPELYYDFWQEKQAYLAAPAGAVQAVIDETAADRESQVLGDVLLYGMGVAVLGLGVLFLAWIVVRSISRSLRVVTEAAQEIAEVRLPHLLDSLRTDGELPPEAREIEPVPVLTDDELGDLAKAFNAVQDATMKVAHEQAAMLRKGIGDLYINLARRNQSLVDRQISLLDDLEARADDPDQLASLFEIDHLATRMRRNAESLLVMSGATQPRQWSESISILDVVRAAAGEIADFPRVVFTGFDSQVAIAGNAVADVTHILAELLENATAFSPPGTPVVVAGMVAEHRFVITITDEGIGIDDARLAAANDLLTRPPAPGLALSRSLGLHVVAHLASRYRIRVQLRRSMTQGVTAIVALPPELLARGSGGDGRVRGPAVHRPTDDETGARRSAPTDVEFPFARPSGAPSPPAPEPTVVGSRATDAPPGSAPVVSTPVVSPSVVTPSVVAPPWDAPTFAPAAASMPAAASDDRDTTVEGEALFFDVAGSVELPRRVPGNPAATATATAPPVLSVDPVVPVLSVDPVQPVAPPAPSAAPAAPAWEAPSMATSARSATPPPGAAPDRPVTADVEFPFPGPTGAAVNGAGTRAAGSPDGPHHGVAPSGPESARWSDLEFPDEPADEYPIDPETGLPQRTPGLHLSHDPTVVGVVEGDPRPRPERVHDLLTRHLHGIQHGRSESAPAYPEDES